MFGKYNGFVSKARVSACMYFLVCCYLVALNAVLFSVKGGASVVDSGKSGLKSDFNATNVTSYSNSKPLLPLHQKGNHFMSTEGRCTMLWKVAVDMKVFSHSVR